ncbi:hypothetical protein O181_052951 [Austropuccinia psidii MF-1]|uniref:Reverse transcriptase domain-containing protein n=1 Tax=Austropuccinia psidii MF-1 TaxID=1389203 RepID=A0A9Q3HPR1_9BASI|nr:hypothetical protein [Austropuccinia psidii MF-1]
MLRKNRPVFAIGEEQLGKIRGHDIEFYLDVERPYLTMLRRPLYPASLKIRKEIDKHINELLEMDFIRKIGHDEIVEITTPVLITWHDGTLDKLEKAEYVTEMDYMKGFHHNILKPKSMKLLGIICHMGIYEYTRMPFGLKNAPAHFQRMIDTIFQSEILEGWMVVYIDEIIIYSETWKDHVQ